MGGLTVNETVEDLIREYHAVLPPGLTMNETDMLLGALLMEMQAQRVANGHGEAVEVVLNQRNEDGGDPDETGTYEAEEVTAVTGEWTEIDLSFITSEVDLRNISADVLIAFSEPTDESAVIPYGKSDSPVAGIQVATSKVWVRAVSTETTFNVEAWQ
ncbi:hypothetical protein GJ631_14875 [Natronomonas sp. CBA1123]|uniref:hypothetical protein n=1 Tax=Natronomonas sp. CBA1123 TaxID=2668070 RepID=UPI0012E9B476|nr:hypothetical protein [Natronomonas sp. CBA1123]MUV87799.1 hypothetical protein [Natronomonas sp. CBA1123]